MVGGRKRFLTNRASRPRRLRRKWANPRNGTKPRSRKPTREELWFVIRSMAIASVFLIYIALVIGHVQSIVCP